MNSSSCVSMFIVIIFVHQTLNAQGPVTFNLRGVTAGVTRLDQLKKNDNWGDQLGSSIQPDGCMWLEYRFWAWQKVTAVITYDAVQTIDAIPPERVPASKLTQSLKLGALTAVANANDLPAAAFVGPEANGTDIFLTCFGFQFSGLGAGANFVGGDGLQ